MRDRWISHKFHADWFCNSPVQAEMCRHLSKHVAGVTTCITFLHNAFDFLLFEIHRPARRPKEGARSDLLCDGRSHLREIIIVYRIEDRENRHFCGMPT